MKHILPLLAGLLLLLSSCEADFDPNAPWREVPSVYCVVDPDEDTVWVRVQRCFQGQSNLYSYSADPDSNYYRPADISVHLLAWDDAAPESPTPIASATLADRWELAYTLRPGKPDGAFPSGLQPLYYCVPGPRLTADTDCLFQLVILRNPSGDTLASAFTTLVGILPPVATSSGTIEQVIINPSKTRAHEFGFITGCYGFFEWNPLPRGRLYQPFVTFRYQKGSDTLQLTIPGATTTTPSNGGHFVFKPFTERLFLDKVRQHLASNTDTLYNVNNVDITLTVCNDDLYQYMQSQHRTIVGGQELASYTNIDGGVGIFASRRTHITVNVPCDSFGNPDNLPQRLVDLGVGFYGNFL